MTDELRPLDSAESFSAAQLLNWLDRLDDLQEQVEDLPENDRSALHTQIDGHRAEAFRWLRLARGRKHSIAALGLIGVDVESS